MVSSPRRNGRADHIVNDANDETAARTRRDLLSFAELTLRGGRSMSASRTSWREKSAYSGDFEAIAAGTRVVERLSPRQRVAERYDRGNSLVWRRPKRNPLFPTRRLAQRVSSVRCGQHDDSQYETIPLCAFGKVRGKKTHFEFPARAEAKLTFLVDKRHEAATLSIRSEGVGN